MARRKVKDPLFISSSQINSWRKDVLDWRGAVIQPVPNVAHIHSDFERRIMIKQYATGRVRIDKPGILDGHVVAFAVPSVRELIIYTQLFLGLFWTLNNRTGVIRQIRAGAMRPRYIVVSGMDEADSVAFEMQLLMFGHGRRMVRIDGIRFDP